jgi:ATP-dependent helicase/nuclease subunit A
MTTIACHPRESILASAGSGKTFRISSRIIGLLAAGEPPVAIFASTFTRKAAGEILERVLVRLARAAMDADEARSLAEHAALDPASPPPPDPAFWLGVLRRTVHQLHRVDVGTLDAFFVRALGVFAHELGLPAGWGIADEPMAERVRADALQDVLTTVDDGVRVELVRGLAAGAARRDVLGRLVDEVAGIMAVHDALDPAAPGWGALRALVEERPADLEDRCQALADRMLEAPVPVTVRGAPDGRWHPPLAEAAAAVRARDWDRLTGRTLFCRAIDDPWQGFHGTRIPDRIASLMREALELARIDLGPEYAARAEAMGRLARLFADAFDARLRREGALRFDDVTRLLAGAAPVGGRSDLFYRLDGRTRHLLLDEFQDTSLLQWSALEPLADRLLGRPAAGREAGREGGVAAGDHAAVIVADPKQSIYGWRGAAPLLVGHVTRRYGLHEQVLATSYRSSRVVLDVVNTIFTGIEDREALADRPADRAVAVDWGRTFAPHVAARNLPGHVRLEVGPRDAGRGAEKPALCRWAAARIRDLHRAAPGRSIGVLTRTNATVARLMFELRELGVPASEEGGAPLIDSAAVASVLALLRLADHPGDGLAAYHVARTPVGDVVGLSDPRDRLVRARVAHRFRERLVEHGYGRTLADIARRVAVECTARERARLARLVELGFRWDGRATLRVDDFVRAAMAERVEVSARSDIRVMTVHQAKGLEFDVVVLPELEAPLIRGANGRAPLAYRPDGVGAITHVFPPMPAHHRRVFGSIGECQAAYEQLRGAAIRDALSTLYVAVTRARHALHMMVAADGDNGPGTARTHGRLVREALAGPPSADQPAAEGDVLYESGDPDWHRTAAGAQAPAAPRSDAPPPAITLRPVERRGRMLGRRRPTDPEEGGALDVARLLGAGSSDAGREYGSLVHAWLERLEWIEAGLPGDGELAAIAGRVAPRMEPARVQAVRERLARGLEEPAIRAALSRARYPDGARVRTELAFLHREGEVLLEGVIDRLVVVTGGGGVVAAEVLDYKTDALAGDPAVLAERVRRYAPQVAAYRRAVAAMFRLDPAAVTGTLVFLGEGVVQPLPPG